MSATTIAGAPTTTSPSRELATVLGLVALFAPFGSDMYLPGLASMAAELRTGTVGAQLTFSAFLLGMAAGHLALGRLSDRYGRRGPLLACLAVCAVAGAVCALAPTIGVLIGARFVQGLTGAAGVVIARAVVSDLARGRRAVRVFAAQMWALAAVPVVAPPIGGALVAVAGWRAVFGALALLSLLMFLAALIALPETLPLHARAVSPPLRRRDLSVLRTQGRLAPVLAFVLAFGALAAYLAAAPFFLRALGLPLAGVGLTLGLNALALVLVAAVGARIAHRFRPLAQAQAGMAVLLACAAVLWALAATGWLTADTCLPPLLLAVASLGLVLGDTSAVAFGRTTRAAGTAATLTATAQFAFGALTAPLAGVAGARSVMPMALIMGVCAMVALVALAVSESSMMPGDHSGTAGIGSGYCDQPE
ncbi:Bcr/CflA family efflux MFS transporter [Sphaerisporangium sp. NPDC005288]|uniref:Bcr/CflA family efflux MFS transporter n=1 Tax=Sphaerisporangium sp. NPDC005288 TaxID=3155114 RepID=UPI0033B3701B